MGCSMTKGLPSNLPPASRLLSRLARDTSGNVMAMIAAALFPLLALVGGGIDMGRGYLAQSRLQQACDAGALAARKRLGTTVAVDSDVPSEAAEAGQRFFNINFRDGAYGTRDRSFQLILEQDFSITANASVNVPTTIMAVFGFTELPISVSCTSQINMANTDIMMVLDTTGSMNRTNSGDSQTRIQTLRDVVKGFHAQMEANKGPTTRIRYGFVPYSTNVNVGHLLRDEWLVDEWSYNFREAVQSPLMEEVPIYEYDEQRIRGTKSVGSTYLADSCPGGRFSADMYDYDPDDGGWEVEYWYYSGQTYEGTPVDDAVEVTPVRYSGYRFKKMRRQIGTEWQYVARWLYDNIDVDLGFLADSNSVLLPFGGSPGATVDVSASFRGCIEERDTYEIANYDNVDLERALDLDIDLVPDPNDPATQWRPMLNELSYIREILLNGRGQLTPGPVLTDEEFVNAYW